MRALELSALAIAAAVAAVGVLVLTGDWALEKMSREPFVVSAARVWLRFGGGAS